MRAYLHAQAAALADAFLSGAWTSRGLIDRGVITLSGKPRWLLAAVRRALKRFPEPPHTARSALIEAIGTIPSFLRAMEHGRHPRLAWQFLDPFAMGPKRWDVPDLPTSGDLADWLGLSVPELEWFADRRNLLRDHPEGPVQHYLWRWVEKRSGGLRLLEVPKPRLRAIQRRILRGILDRVPPHEAAHGFRPGRSALTYALPHVGQPVVVRIDLRDFFPSTRAERVRRIFGALGYPEEVAATLTALCTARAPRAVRERAPQRSPVATRPTTAESGASPDGAVARSDHWSTVRRLASAHLPQGAPTSPALANLAAYGLDLRLAAAAASIGAVYTRYADDLALSGSFDADRVVPWIASIVLDEGYAPNFHKTRVRTQAQRQQLAGVVVNVHPNAARDEVDRLKAILHNCARFGPDSQNRDGHPDFRAHLAGRVGWVRQRNPARAAKLEALFDRVHW